MIDGISADGVDEMFNLTVCQCQTITLLANQTDDVQLTTVVVPLQDDIR